MKPPKILSQLVDQYQQKHNRPPERIVVHPAAAVILAHRRSLGPVWNGLPVVCEEVKPVELGHRQATALGVTVYKNALIGFDL